MCIICYEPVHALFTALFMCYSAVVMFRDKNFLKYIRQFRYVVLVAGIAILIPSFYLKKASQTVEVVVSNGENTKIQFAYGSWPALENARFFEKVKQDFVSKQTDFIEADLSAMLVRMYRKGALVKEVPIVSKGKPGSWWETPAGLYKIEAKKESHYSSFGHVYLPYSMPFQGNFFIHGWPRYENGKPVPEGYSGGCIRLSDENAKEVYSFASVGMPVLVYEQSFGSDPSRQDFSYTFKQPQVSAVSYLAADLENNFVFLENKPSERRSIASLTKLMTALVGVEYINVEREVTITPSMLVETGIPRLKAGDRFSVLDVLSALLMESSNEAARAVAVSLGEKRFVQLMNTKAVAIGMKQSAFVDTSGALLGNVSTVEDLFALAKYLYYNRSFVLHMSVGKESRAVYGLSAFKNLKNLNAIPSLQGMVGGKTDDGDTASDGMLAVFEITIGGKKRPIAIIVLGSRDGKRDVEEVFQYVLSNYERKDSSALDENAAL